MRLAVPVSVTTTRGITFTASLKGRERMAHIGSGPFNKPTTSVTSPAADMTQKSRTS